MPVIHYTDREGRLKSAWLLEIDKRGRFICKDRLRKKFYVDILKIRKDSLLALIK